MILHRWWMFRFKFNTTIFMSWDCCHVYDCYSHCSTAYSGVQCCRLLRWYLHGMNGFEYSNRGWVWGSIHSVRFTELYIREWLVYWSVRYHICLFCVLVNSAIKNKIKWMKMKSFFSSTTLFNRLICCLYIEVFERSRYESHTSYSIWIRVIDYKWLNHHAEQDKTEMMKEHRQ